MLRYEQNSVSVEGFNDQSFPSRRRFLQRSTALTAGFSALVGTLSLPKTVEASDSNLNIFGPRTGYTPQLGTFVSILTWMREFNGVISATKDLTAADLDHLIDSNANTIGALMLHLAATETYISSIPSMARSGTPGRIP